MTVGACGAAPRNIRFVPLRFGDPQTCTPFEALDVQIERSDFSFTGLPLTALVLACVWTAASGANHQAHAMVGSGVAAPSERPSADVPAVDGANGAAAPAPAQPIRVDVVWTETRPAETPPARDDDARRREQLGRLAFARVSIEADQAPLRDVLHALRRALGLNMMLFEQRAEHGNLLSGINGGDTVDLALSEVDGYTVLDALVSVAGPDAAWQLNGSVIEIGNKSHLARHEARRSVVLEAADLSLIAPDFAACGGGESYNRLDGAEVLGDLVRMISTHCEPQAFEPAPERVHDAVPTGSGGGLQRGPVQLRTSPNTNAWRNLDPRVGPVFVHGRWASIQVRDTALAVVAPDFVLRRIAGYPKPLPPRATDPAKRVPMGGRP